jgi:hypothetical protein
MHRWEDSILLDLREIGWEGVYWSHLAQGRKHWIGCCEHGNEPSGSIISREFLDQLSDSRTLLCAVS